MPLPLIIGGIAAVAGATGIGTGIHGGVKLKNANDAMKRAESMQREAIELFERKNKKVSAEMDEIGKKELEILKSFRQFSDLIEKIQGRPDFKKYSQEGIELPAYEAEELQKVSAGAGVLLGGLGGAATGTAGGFAAAGATTSAVMALGTASTGTAISSLSGVAATNATLAALGGGSLAAGGGGMALGSMVLGGATLGVGLLVGGIIFNATGKKLSNKADEAYQQAQKTKKEVDNIVLYLNKLDTAANRFESTLSDVEKQYSKRLEILDHVVNFSEKTMWCDFTDKEKQMTENLVLLVGILHKMCQTKLVLKSEEKDGLNNVNQAEINKVVYEASYILVKTENAA